MDPEKFSPPAPETKESAQGTIQTSQAALRATWGQIIAPSPQDATGRTFAFITDSVPDSPRP